MAEDTEGLALVLAIPSALRHLANGPDSETPERPAVETKDADQQCGF
jgi:hypothetical protein